ncbi:hypothetical protein AB0P17_00570 [Streptomyces sp. NPDC088124]
MVAERITADALHPYPEGVVVATKVGNTRPGLSVCSCRSAVPPT